MGLFTWLGSLVDQLIEWLGRAFKAFIDGLMSVLKRLWDTVVVTDLIAAFGFAATLYVIFYAGAALGKTIMEIWDPNYYSSKPSKVFKLKKTPQNTPLPTNRSKAKVLELEDWN